MEDDFSVGVCKRWKKTFEEQRTPFTRKIALRLAITLGKGGVMVPYRRLVKFGLGDPQGNGRQMYSWIHIDGSSSRRSSVRASGKIAGDRFPVPVRKAGGRGKQYYSLLKIAFHEP